MRNFILIMYCFVLVPYVIILSYAISNVVERKSSYGRALVCAVYINVCFIYEFALCMWAMSVIHVAAFAIIERFNVLSRRLQRLFFKCSKRDIHNLICKHVELCDFIKQVNDKWNEYMFIVYGSLLTSVCFFIYNTVFPDMSLPLYVIMCLTTILAVTIAIVASFVTSRFCIAAYDSFQEIRIMSALPLSLTEKLIIIFYFMKRFRENSIGFNIGDCFILSKETPVEVYNALNTIFKMMLEIRNIMKGKSSHCIPRNASLPFYNTGSID
ncbi:uncharacterized protein LOC111642620 [Centruroides sculpturatus]|uniref:uncharacterized protein LOC111642620 n=1 Tax=Centruroides sculpturatus TaxID=218467 RepID=UPI000C6E95BD|nr:uncharacterized protein LOC111642620 [Centruroides sculpturatus]